MNLHPIFRFLEIIHRVGNLMFPQSVEKLQTIQALESFQILIRSKFFDALNVDAMGVFAEFALLILFSSRINVINSFF